MWPAEASPRVPPHNYEAEQALLGAVLLNNRALEKVSEFLRPEHFADPTHGRIFQACGKLVGRNHPANPVTLKTYFEQDGGLAEIGGTQYLAQLANAVVSIINAEDYGRLIHDLHLRRELIALGEDMVNEAFAPSLDRSALEIAHSFEQRLFDATEHQDGASEGCQSLAAVVPRAEARMREAWRNGGRLVGLSTGLDDLDETIGGLAPENLIIVGARPGMGKTGLGLTIAHAIACSGVPVGFFSLEMSGEELTHRMVSSRESIAGQDIRRGRLTDAEWERCAQAMSQLLEVPLHIDDTAGLTVDQIRVRGRRMRRRRGVGLIVIDHMHRIRCPGSSRYADMTAISASLKDMARELGIPVLVLCQLSRAVEQREDKRPVLSDLRESGSIEQDADVVAFLYRHAYYLEREEPQPRKGESRSEFLDRISDWNDELARERGRAEVIVAKNRHGPLGKVELAFDAPYSRFSSLSSGG